MAEQQVAGDRTNVLLTIEDWDKFESAMSYLHSNHVDVDVWERPSHGGRDLLLGSIRPNPLGEPQLADLAFLNRTHRNGGLNKGDKLLFAFKDGRVATLFKLTWG